MSYATHFQHTPQSEPIFGHQMVENAAGGFVFEIDDWQRLRRFLIIGTEGGSYYEGERKLTLENAACIKRCLALDGARAVREIVEVSDRGLAIKNDPAVFALACATVFGDVQTRKAAFDALPQVCRISTHLFQFAEAREALGGGWGRSACRAVSKWYLDRDDIVHQALKYQQRGGWSHRDLLRLAHPKAGVEQGKVFDAICRPAKWAEVDTPLAEGWVKVQQAERASDVADLISAYNLPRELVPTRFLVHPEVWDAMLPRMPMTALVRNLGNLSKCGLLKPLSDASKFICSRLSDEDAIKRSRLHPFSVLIAAKTYASGHGARGNGEWQAVPQVIDALDRAFDLAFHNVEPTGKRHVLGVDVSGSMSYPTGAAMSCAEAAAAMALITARVEPNYYIMGFSDRFQDLGITARDTLPTVLEKTRDRNFGGTNTALAVEWAIKNKIEADVFVIYTDNETWCGDRHTSEAIKDYRRKAGIAAKLAVVAFTGTQRSVADGADHGSMDFVGMDASLPQALSEFVLLD